MTLSRLRTPKPRSHPLLGRNIVEPFVTLLVLLQNYDHEDPHPNGPRAYKLPVCNELSSKVKPGRKDPPPPKNPFPSRGLPAVPTGPCLPTLTGASSGQAAQTTTCSLHHSSKRRHSKAEGPSAMTLHPRKKHLASDNEQDRPRPDDNNLP